MAAYCTSGQFATYGLPQSRWTGKEAVVTAQLAASSEIFDGYLRRARYVLPLTAWGEDVAKCVAEHAALGVLSVVGYNPANGGDDVISERAKLAEERMAGIVTRRWQPNVTDSTSRSEPRAIPMPQSDTAAGY